MARAGLARRRWRSLASRGLCTLRWRALRSASPLRSVTIAHRIESSIQAGWAWASQKSRRS
ncbi:MAG: hypothetical protein CL910_15100 [Deltaproteobacteria bacterium]|nr:hypothetical protein [Deltaproteobacteria bacterium]